MDEMILSNAQACRAWGISRKTLAEWVQKGLPMAGRSKYPLFAGSDWIRQFTQVNTTSLTEERTRLVKTQADLKSLQLLVEKGILVSKEEVVGHNRAAIFDAKQKFLLLRRTLPPKLVGLEAREMSDIIRKEIRRILENLYIGINKKVAKRKRRR
jgi:transposase-like protein